MSNAPIEDESWSDLAAELGVGTPPPGKPPEPAAPRDEASALAHETDPELDVAGGDGPDAADGEPDDTVVIPALSAEPVAEGAGDDPGQGGRKRRRRRRRKKKGGAPQEGGEAGPRPALVGGEDDDADAEDEEVEAEEESGEPAPAGIEEPTAEAARDVIANWNVPSWDQIIAGLYRPDR